MRKLLDYDPGTRISHVFHYDESTDEATITAEQKFDDIVEMNKSLYNRDHQKHGDWTHVAQIPLVVVQELKKQGILHDQKAMKRWLNDPQNRFFRTRPGSV